MLTMWNMEEVKVVIEVEGMEPYEVTSETGINDNDRRFIQKINSIYAENNSSNPFGLCGSHSFTMSIVDIDDYLSVTNKESPYYKKIKNGNKVIIYLKNTETDEFEQDSICYINNISGSFNNGAYQAVSISCQDKLDSVGSQNNPKIPCYRNITVGDFLNIIFSSIGLVRNIDWKINDELSSRVLLYGITVGSKIRDTLNGLAQFLQARIIIDKNNVIRIEKALNAYGNEYKLGYDLVNNLSNIYASNVNYSEIIVNYNVDGYKVEDVLLNDSSYKLHVGENILENVKFKNKALSIRHLTVQFDKKLFDSTVNSILYQGYQDGLTRLVINVEGQDISNCTIYAEGMSIEKSTRAKTTRLTDEENTNGAALSLDIKYIINESEADTLINSLKETIDKSSRQITIKTIATPFIKVGDKVILEDEEFTSTYKGEYKVIKVQTNHGLNYSNTLTLIEL